jgi:drug/metabolite transporter (DMT)-like permease
MLACGLALALASAFATNVGFLLRHRGAVAAPDVDVSHPLRSAIALFRSKWWTIGYLVAALAYVLHVAALALASLSVVQAVLAGGLALLGVIAERWFGFRLSKREWTGLGLAATGLAFLALTGAGESGAESSDYSLVAMIAWESTLVALGAALIVLHRRRRSGSRRGVLLAVAAGFLFTVTHVAVKAVTGHAGEGAAAIAPYAVIVVAAAIVAFFASARSLQIGDAVPVIAMTSIASNASAIPAGVVVFSDPMGDGAVSVVVRSLAFVFVVAAAAAIPGPTRAAARRKRAPATA